MRIDFSYSKKAINSTSGYIFKGKHYRCSYVRYPSPYRKPAAGTEIVELYHFIPRSEVRASVIILQGLGSANVKFLIWLGTHLASSGVNAALLILPGNYTRVEDGSVSGSSYLKPPLRDMYRFWEHAVVDTFSVIDMLQQADLWKENNCLLGYCLGGMVGTIAAAMDRRIAQTVLMTTGGHFPQILHESKITRFVRKGFTKDACLEYDIDNREKLYRIYDEQLPLVRTMTLTKLLRSNTIHPLFRIDPLAYAHLLDKKSTVFIDALFDRILPAKSRWILYREMKGATRYLVPLGHVSWLPFEYILARYILYKVHINDKKAARMLMLKETIREPLDEFEGYK